MKSRISRWSKWDLHIHTRASKRKKGNNEYFGAGFSFTDEEIKEFVDHIFPEKLSKLIAITDHDYFDYEQFLKIKKEVERISLERGEDYCVLPGVECDIYFKINSLKEVVVDDDIQDFLPSDRVHVILIFNDEGWDEQRYKRLHVLIEEKYEHDDPIYIGDLLSKFIQNKFEFIAIPHFDKDKGIEDAIPDIDHSSKKKITNNMTTKTNWLLSGYFPLLDAVERDFTDLKIIEFYNQINEKQGFATPLILTSDNHDYRTYDGSIKLSWYKACPSFKGLKMCCSDFEMRVKYDPDIPKASYISKIIIDGASDLVSRCEIELSDNLNCVIGGRSSGKSLLLKKIMLACESPTAELELKHYKKYRDGMSVKLLGSDGLQYRGQPEYISQGSIIQKYINADNSTNLATDFKEYFPKNIDFDSILKEKERIKIICSKIDSILQKFYAISIVLSNKNILDYLRISKTKFNNTISNKVLVAQCDMAKKLVGDLRSFLSIVENNKYLLLPFQELTASVDELIGKIKKELSAKQTVLNRYDLIKKASINFVYNLDAKAEGYDKKEKTQIAAIGSLVNSVLEWCAEYHKLIESAQLLKQTVDSLKQSETYINEIPSFKFAIKITNTLTITDIFQVFSERIKNKDIRETTKNFYQLFDKCIAHDYELYSTKNLNVLLNDKLDSSYKVEYLIYEKGELINNMSEGRKVSVFLNILLNRNDSIDPLIIDQPEDDMDNNDIYSILVDSLRKRKSGRQIILATHDSNIVVNGDAENVIYASKSNKKARISYEYGGLEYQNDAINVQKLICDTLEGGETAFINRAYKYDLDKTKIYKWRD